MSDRAEMLPGDSQQCNHTEMRKSQAIARGACPACLAESVESLSRELHAANEIDRQWIAAKQAAEQRATEARRERDVLALEVRVSDSEMMALLKRVNKEFQDRAESAEDVLRSLASFLGVGGYNSEKVDAAAFEAKIRNGIDMLTKPLVERATEAERQEESWKASAGDSGRVAAEALARATEAEWQRDAARRSLEAVKLAHDGVVDRFIGQFEKSERRGKLLERWLDREESTTNMPGPLEDLKRETREELGHEG